MLTRVHVVQPLFSVIVDESTDSSAKPVCGDAQAAGEAVGANGANPRRLRSIPATACPAALADFAAVYQARHGSEHGPQRQLTRPQSPPSLPVRQIDE